MDKPGSLQNGPEPVDFRRKLTVVMILICAALSVLTIRLWYLQIIKGDELKQRSENNAVRFRKIQPLRGLIMDHNGDVSAIRFALLEEPRTRDAAAGAGRPGGADLVRDIA